MQSENNDAIDAAVRRVFAATLGITAEGRRDIGRSETPTWNSLRHIEMLFAVEDACGVRFSDQELAELDSLAGVVQSVRCHLGT